jgi:transcriptional regulator with XRE-family HTH domain
MGGKRANNIDVAVGHRIRLFRLNAGLSQTELADQIGVTFQQVQKYEKGINRIGAGRLVRVAKALDVPISFFVGTTDDDGLEDTHAILEFLDTSYSLRLLRAFSRIEDTGVQRSVLELVENIAPEADRSRH